MSDTLDILKTLALQVRNASSAGENTAERVGRTLVGIIDTFVDIDSSYVKNPAFSDLKNKLDTFLEGSDTDGIINKWKELEAFLSGQTQSSTLADLLAVKADKNIEIKAGTGLTGGGTLSATRTLSLAATGTAGTYTKVTTDAYGRVTSGSSLAASDIPTLAIDKVSGLQSALNNKLDTAYFKRVFGVLDANDNELSGNDMTTVIASLKLKVGTWTEEYFSIKGKNPGTGGSVSLALSQLADISLSSPGNGESLVYSAGLGKWVNGAAGLSKVTVKLGNVSYDSVDGTVYLPAYPTSLPASDVYPWAKQPNKPGYVWDEIGNKPTTFTPSAHSHSFASLTSVPTTLSGYGISDAFRIAVVASGSDIALSGYQGGYWGGIGSYASFVQSGYNYGGQLQFSSNGIAQRYINNGSIYYSWRRLLDDSNYNSYAVSLSTSQTITGNKTFSSNSFGDSIHIWRTTGDSSAIKYFNTVDKTFMGAIGIAPGNIPTYWDISVAPFAILHSGNYNSYSPTLIGGGASGTWSININGGAGTLIRHGYTNANSVTPSVLQQFDVWATFTNTPTNNYTYGLSVGSSDVNYIAQIVRAVGSNSLYHRSMSGGSWGNWFTVLDNNNYASIIDSRYVLKGGDTLPGRFVLSADSTAYHISGTGNLVLQANSTVDSGLVLSSARNAINPFSSRAGSTTLGSSDIRWGNIYSVYGDFTSSINAGGSGVTLTNTSDGWFRNTGVGMGLYNITGDARWRYNGTYWAADKPIGSDVATGTSPIRVLSTTLNTNLNSDLLDGYHEVDIRRRSEQFLDKSTSNYDLNTILEDGGMTSNYNSIALWSNAPSGISYGSAVSFRSSYGSTLRGMLLWDISHNVSNGTRNLYWRASNNLGWCNWKTIAFIDSNVASATKLQSARNIQIYDYSETNTAPGSTFDGTSNIILHMPASAIMTVSQAQTLVTSRNIFGVPFNGNGDVNGTLLLNGVGTGNYDQGIRIKPNGNWSTLVLGGSDLSSNVGTSTNSWLLANSNGNLYLNRNGSNQSTGYELVNVAGNWGFGTISPSYKLHVNGSLYASGAAALASTLSVSGNVTFSSYLNNSLYVTNLSDHVQLRFAGVHTVSFGGQNDGYAHRSYYFRPAVSTSGITYSSLYMQNCQADGATYVTTHTFDYNGNAAHSGYATANRFYAGYDSTQPNSMSCSNWFRSNGATGWINATYGGGIYMDETTYVKIYGGKSFYVPNEIYAAVGVWTDGYFSSKGQNTTSDGRLKKVISRVNLSIEAIAKAPDIVFSWKDGSGTDVGSIAQYWRKVLPFSVKELNNHLTLNYGGAAMVGLISVAKRVVNHEDRITALEKENMKLRQTISNLERRLYA